MPPKRCFICQHYGHAALSCRRKQVCRTCAQDHPQSECTVEDAAQFKGASCGGNHRASSNRCEYHKAALKIAAQLQERSITQVEAATQYARLYSVKPKPTPAKHTMIKSTQEYPNLPIFHSQRTGSQTPRRNNLTPQGQEGGRGPGAVNKSRSYFSQESFEIDSMPTPGQRSRSQKGGAFKPPFHSTQKYSDILNGTGCQRENQEEKDEDGFPSFPPASQCIVRSPGGIRARTKKKKRRNLFSFSEPTDSTDDGTGEDNSNRTEEERGSQQDKSNGFGIPMGSLNGIIQRVVEQIKQWVTKFIQQIVDSMLQAFTL